MVKYRLISVEYQIEGEINPFSSFLRPFFPFALLRFQYCRANPLGEVTWAGVFQRFFFSFAFAPSFSLAIHRRSIEARFLGVSRWREAQGQCYRVFCLVISSQSRH